MAILLLETIDPREILGLEAGGGVEHLEGGIVAEVGGIRLCIVGIELDGLCLAREHR